MSERVENFSLEDCEDNKGYRRVLLQLFGLNGNGKSCFINSCKYVLDGGDFQLYANTLVTDGATTTRRNAYQLTDTIWLVDNRGMTTIDQIQRGEVLAQLGNLVLLDEEVEWCPDFDKRVESITEEFYKKEELCDLIVPIFIHKTSCTISERERPLYKELLEKARELTGITPFIALTHRYSGSVDVMRSTFRDLGMKTIFAFENYTRSESRKVEETHREFIDEVKCSMKDRKSPGEANRHCFKLVIKWLHESHAQQKEEELQKKHEEEKKKKLTWFQWFRSFFPWGRGG